MNNFHYTKTQDLKEAIGLAAENKSAKFIAGGTNLIDLWKYDLVHFNSLLDINQNDSDIMETSDGGLRLSAFYTNADTAYHPLVEQRYPLLSKAILAGASAQIRNMATNGGNLLQRTRCYYFYDAATPCNKREPGTGCSALNGINRIHAILGSSPHCIAVFPSDMCVALSALDARVNVSGINGDRTIAFENFHRLPGDTPELDNTLLHDEIITSIDLPPNNLNKNYSYLKLRDRNSYAFALVSVAAAFDLENNIIQEARIALGGVAHKPWRNKAAEAFLQGKMATRENFALAADIILAESVPYKYNSFKIELGKRAIIRNCLMALDPDSQLPGAQPSK